MMTSTSSLGPLCLRDESGFPWQLTLLRKEEPELGGTLQPGSSQPRLVPGAWNRAFLHVLIWVH